MREIPNPVWDYILNHVTECEPDALLVVAEDFEQADAIAGHTHTSCRYMRCRPQQAHECLASGTRYDLAVVCDALETMSRADAEQLLGRLRDYSATRVLVVIHVNALHDPDDAVWRQSDFIALGFSRCAETRALADGWQLYRYDIHDYKRTPSWLNARYWANPERWGKKRW